MTTVRASRDVTICVPLNRFWNVLKIEEFDANQISVLTEGFREKGGYDGVALVAFIGVLYYEHVLGCHKGFSITFIFIICKNLRLIIAYHRF